MCRLGRLCDTFRAAARSQNPARLAASAPREKALACGPCSVPCIPSYSTDRPGQLSSR